MPLSDSVAQIFIAGVCYKCKDVEILMVWNYYKDMNFHSILNTLSQMNIRCYVFIKILIRIYVHKSKSRISKVNFPQNQILRIMVDAVNHLIVLTNWG